MKSKIIAILFFMLISFSLSAQKFKYCEVKGNFKFLSEKLEIKIDSTGTMQVSIFENMIDASNFLGKNGWELTGTFVFVYGQNNIYHWIFKKKI